MTTQPAAMTSALTQYTVTIIDRRRKRTRYIALARCWYDAWLTAANTHGLVALVMVAPARKARPC